jgi:hypothetical protein
MSQEVSWRELSVGDRVRIVRMPDEFSQEGYFVHEEERLAYEFLIRERRVLKVKRIDEWGHPWVEFRCRSADGVMVYHELALNHSGLRRVQNRTGRRSDNDQGGM